MCKYLCDMLTWSPLCGTQDWYRCRCHSLSYHIHGHLSKMMSRRHQVHKKPCGFIHIGQKWKSVRCTLRSRWENQGKKIHVYHILFIHSSGDGHGDCFRFLADVNSAIRRWLEMWVSQWYDVLESFGNTLVLFGHEECNRDFRGIDGARDHWVRRHKLHCERQVWYVWDLHACVYKT